MKKNINTNNFFYTYDPTVDAMYIYFKKIDIGEATRTEPFVLMGNLMVNFDYNINNYLIGIEILAAKHSLYDSMKQIEINFVLKKDFLLISFGSKDKLIETVLLKLLNDSVILNLEKSSGNIVNIEIPKASQIIEFS